MSFNIPNPLDVVSEITNKKFNSSITKKTDLEQFEKCDVKTCKFYNEEGHCSYETCRIKLDDPMVASMVTKICQFCGNKFATNLSGMAIQACPACLDAALKAEGHPHKCMFCGRNLDSNPSFFFPCCSTCLDKLKIITGASTDNLSQACSLAHCDSV